MTETRMDTDGTLPRPANWRGRRRANRTGILALAIVPLLLIATACGSDSSDTIGFHFTGKPHTGVPSQVAWEAHLDLQVDGFQFDSGTAVLTSGAGVSRIVALDATSGATRFDDKYAALPPDLDGVLGFGDGRLLVGASGDGGIDGRVDAFDVATGTKLWSVPLDLKDPLPVIVGDAVLIANHDVGQSTGHVHLYALADGKERWNTPLSIAPVANPRANDHDRGAALLTVDAKALTVQTGSGTSVAQLDLETGAVAWEHDTGRPILRVQPVEAEERVVVLTSAADENDVEHRVEAISTVTGTVVWSAETADNTFVIDGDDVLVAADLGGTWTAFDLTSGSMQWSNYGDGSSVLAVSGKFAVTDGLSVFDVATGERAWSTGRFQASEDVHVVGDVVLADSASHNPTAYDLATGTALWTLTDGFVIEVLERSSTVLTQNVDVIELHDLHTGEVLWRVTVGDKIGVRATTDADGNLYIFLDRYQKSVATIIAITAPPA